jgi:hypothetical protein
MNHIQQYCSTSSIRASRAEAWTVYQPKQRTKMHMRWLQIDSYLGCADIRFFLVATVCYFRPDKVDHFFTGATKY